MNLVSFLNRWLEHKVIVNCDHDAYLLRWYLLRTKAVSVFLHKFVRSDEDRALHDHPWDFLVIPIWRGYIEHSDRKLSADEIDNVFQKFWLSDLLSDLRKILSQRVPVRRRVWPIIGTRFRRGEYRHRVELFTGKDGAPLPSWSLFVKFTTRRTWGFWPKEGFVAWNKWWQEKCE